jgi:DNA-binding SARP family transcriptional activator/tetratricopeptide (TPR) repeat protein/TolB-like protein
MHQLCSLGELRLLGPDGEILAARRKELVLLVYLARQSPGTVTREALAALLWGDGDEARSRHSLRQALFELKRALGPVLETDQRGIGLRDGHVLLDATALADDLAAGRLSEAVGWWRGEFLEGLEDLGGPGYRQWLEEEREGLRRQVVWALERLTSAAERAQAWREMSSWAYRWTLLEPLEEAPHRKLIRALHQDDRTAEALAHHARVIARLRDAEAEPSPAFAGLTAGIQWSGRAEAVLSPVPGSVALFTPDLVGRAAELSELHAAWRAAREGVPTVVVLEGDDGSGKTRLAETFLRSIEHDAGPAFVLRARGEAGGAARGEAWPLAATLLGPLRVAPGLAGAPDRALADLSALIPSLRERFPDLPPPRRGETALAPALVQVLGDVASETPVLIFIDDFPAADPPSFRLIVSLARQLPDAGVLLLVTAGDADTEATAELRSLPGARRIRLRPLSADDIDALIASMLACAVTDRRRLAERLHAEGDGNPMFVTETVAALVDDGRLSLDARGYWRLSPNMAGAPLPLPATVREALVHRFDRLDDETRRVLIAAALLPQPFGSATLQDTVGLPAARTDVALDRLVASRLLRTAASPPDHYAFSHPLVHRAARELPRASPPDPTAEMPAATTRTSLPRASIRPTRRAWRRPVPLLMFAAAAVGILVLAAALRWLDRGPAEPAARVLAVGLIRDYTGSDTATIARALPDMLATNLARVPALQVVSQARMYEILEQLGRPAPTAAALADAARRSGAHELIEGELYRFPGRPLRLELRFVDLETGRVKGVYDVDADDVFALVNDVTDRLALDISGEAAPFRVAGSTTTSLVAYRLYEEGLRAHYQGDLSAARRLLRAALAEDSVFGLAAYFVWRTEQQLGLGGDSAIESRIYRLAEYTPERERLLMRGLWASITADPAMTAVAETLVARYPAEPDGHFLLARARLAGGEFLAALPHLDQVLRLDSLSLNGHAARCRACDAMANVITAYSLADSLVAAERVAREWVRRQPNSGLAWSYLAAALESLGRTEESLAAQQRGAPLRPGNAYDPIYPAMLAIRAGQFEPADRLLREQALAGTPAVRAEALWFWTISLRYQGRLHDALRTARALRRLGTDSVTSLPGHTVAEAQVLFELGRFREAAALFDSLAAFPAPDIARKPLVSAGWRTWRLTHAATALAAAGDTTALAQLVDSIQSLGAEINSARDRRLHHYARGLLLIARGELEEAAAEFHRALHSLPFGFSRNNLELSRALLALGRSDEAIRVLQPAFRGSLEVGSLYTTRTELHAQLGRAFEAAGHADSAATHYRAVLRAWRAPDPDLNARRDSIRARLTALGAGR